MTIEKLKSGSYRVKQMYKGKYYSVTLPYKPTKKEATILLAEKMQNDLPQNNKTENGTFKYFSDKYIEKCETGSREKAALSPATVRCYINLANHISDSFKSMNIFDITEKDIQNEINRFKEDHAPKTVRNFNGFLKCVFETYRPNFLYRVELPSPQKKMEYEPTTKDIQRIIEYATGSNYEIALRLAVLGLRRGEVVAITSADISEDNVLTIDKDMVRDKNGVYAIKNKPKTAESYRRILIPQSIADMIREQGYAFKGYPGMINEYLHKVQDRLGIPRFRHHMMRHFAVAYLHKEGFTDQQILTYGGWSNDSNVMKRAYRYNLDPEESQKSIADTFNNLM